MGLIVTHLSQPPTLASCVGVHKLWSVVRLQGVVNKPKSRGKLIFTVVLTNLQHNLVDGSSIRFKVEGLVVVVAEVGELKNGVTCETERIGHPAGIFTVIKKCYILKNESHLFCRTWITIVPSIYVLAQRHRFSVR